MSALVVSLCLSEDQSDSILVGVIGRVKPRVEREDVIGGELGIGGKERGERGKREEVPPCRAGIRKLYAELHLAGRC